MRVHLRVQFDTKETLKRLREKLVEFCFSSYFNRLNRTSSLKPLSSAVE